MEEIEEIPSVYVENKKSKSVSIMHLQKKVPRFGWAEVPPPDPMDLKESLLSKQIPSNRPKNVLSAPSLPEQLTNIDDARSTDDSSSQASSSMKSTIKRPSEMSMHFRQRIRQQAKQMVEKKRGSAQLAKRLMRSQSLRSQSQQDPIEDESTLDKQIEETIELGSKYTRHEHTLVPSERIQRIFFFNIDDFDETHFSHSAHRNRFTKMASHIRIANCISSRLSTVTAECGRENMTNPESFEVHGVNGGAMDVEQRSELIGIVHARPRFSTKKHSEMFAGQLTVYPKQRRMINIVGEVPCESNFEDPLFQMESQAFAARPLRDFSILLHHMGQEFVINSGKNILGLEKIFTNRPRRIMINNDLDEENECELFVDFQKAVNWGEAPQSAGARKLRSNFRRVEIDVNRVEFEHHWLFSREDSGARTLRTHFEKYSSVADELFAAIGKYSKLQQQLIQTLSANERERIESKMRSLMDHVDSRKNALFDLGRRLEEEWMRLKRLRKDLTFSSTHIVLQKICHDTSNLYFAENYDVQSLPASFKEILFSPSFILKEIVDKSQRTKIETERLEAIRKCRIQIQIFFNEILVCTTDEVAMEVDIGGGFSANFGRIYSLRVSECPDTICLCVREKFGTRGAPWVDLARIFLPVFDDQQDSMVERNEEIDFEKANNDSTKDEITKNITNELEPSHPIKKDVGSRQSSKQSIEVTANSRRESKISFASNSAIEKSNSRLLSMQFASELVRGGYKGSIGCGGTAPFLCGRVFCRAKALESDANNRVINLERKTSKEKIDSAKSISFSLIPEAMALCSEEEFQSKFSSKFAPQDPINTLTPLHRQTSLKSRSGMSAFEFFAGDSSAQLSATPVLASATSMSGELSLDVYRRIAHAYAVLIRRHLVENFALEQRLKNYAEIVHEESLPTLFRTFGTLFTPPDLSRKLKPMRLPSAARYQQTLRNSYKLILNIQSANNLPERISAETTNVFAEVIFQKQKVRTRIVEGRHANWQETLTLDLDQDYFANNFPNSHQSQQPFDPKNVVDFVEVSVFDQLIAPIQFDEREPNTFHEQVEFRWLGSIRIPFSTIYSLGKVDGLLTLTNPLFLSGYKMPANHRHANIKLLATIDPPLSAPQFVSNESFESGESEENIYRRAKNWENRLRAAFPGRRYVALANDSNGKRLLASRFLCKIPPPPNILAMVNASNENSSSNLSSAIFACVDLVASIPFVDDPILYPGVCDIWTSAVEMLKIGCGTVEEHAILLTCWLLSLKLTASLAVGCALPEGLRAAYVLVELNPDMLATSSQMNTVLINPSNGVCYSINNPSIPFQIGAILTPHNAYANIQRSAQPSLLDFNFNIHVASGFNERLTDAIDADAKMDAPCIRPFGFKNRQKMDAKNPKHKKSNWESLFAEDRQDLVSVQMEMIRYVNVSDDLLTELRANLEREIKLHFDEARQQGIPQWNLFASRILRDILNESWATTVSFHQTADEFGAQSRDASNAAKRRTSSEMIDAEAHLDALRSSYRVSALAFRTAYTSKQALVERVLKLRAHFNNEPGVQHALAVHVQPFVNQIVSVSVALATLVPLSGGSLAAALITPW